MVSLKQTVVNQFAELLIASSQNPFNYQYVIVCNILFVRAIGDDSEGVVAVKYYKFAEQDVKNKSKDWIAYLQSKVNDLLFGRYEKNSVKIILKYFDTENECVEKFTPKSVSSWVVTLEEGTSMQDVTNIPPNKVVMTNVYEYVLNGFSCVTDFGCICYMKENNNCIQNFEADAQVETNANNTVQTVGQFIRRIGANNSSSQSGTKTPLVPVNTNIYAFVIDTGILSTHPDLKIATQYCVNLTTNAKTRWSDDNGHGTHVAGIIGALDNNIGIVGVAPGVNLVAVKVLSKNGSGSISTVIAGVDYVYRWKVANPTLRAVTNMSLGGGFYAPLNTAVNNLSNFNVPVCVAAGNSATNSSTESPASAVNAITVGAYDSINNVLASFSNYGSIVDILAPGVSIDSTYLNNGYTVLSGTSMASPVVAGTIALVMTTQPSLTTTISIRNKIVADSAILTPTNYNKTIGSNPLITLSTAATTAGTINRSVYAGIY